MPQVPSSPLRRPASTSRLSPAARPALPGSRSDFARHFAEVRARTLALADPLSAEDLCVQSMPDASPGKWHLAHTAWFFETVVLLPHQASYAAFDPHFAYLFNSYYEALGSRHPRPERGLLTRPSLQSVHAYRLHVDSAMHRFIERADPPAWEAAVPTITLGLQHEQQHQELMLTDALHLLWCNPLLPAYRRSAEPALRLAARVPPLRFVERAGGVVEVGHDGDGFAFDNETPRHRALLGAHAIADRLVTCGEFAQFVADDGYRRPELWLSDGWAAVQSGRWQSPAYWIAPNDPRAPCEHWQVFGLQGVHALDSAAPVCQISFYEAAAYAEWAGARLPTEFEWEAADDAGGLTQMTGQVWQWTRSSYDPYPGFKPLAGAVSEYNGKFMVGQIVLRGSSLATASGHARRSYRNFFPPAARWQFSGLRLAKDLGC